MERSRSKPEIFDSLRKQDSDLRDQIRTLRNQNLALPDWIAITAFSNSWVNYGGSEDSAAYWRTSNGLVLLRGVIKSGTVGNAAFTLPVGFRPAGTRRFCVVSNALFGHITISSAGVVTISVGSNTYVDLAGVTFRAEG